jgi:hypothetical protein
MNPTSFIEDRCCPPDLRRPVAATGGAVRSLKNKAVISILGLLIAASGATLSRIQAPPASAAEMAAVTVAAHPVALTARLLLLKLTPGTRIEAPDKTIDFQTKFLSEIERRGFNFFVEQTDRVAGLTRDRAPADGGSSNSVYSVAASGFALTVWCIGAERNYLPVGEARLRALNTLRFFRYRAENMNGWFYHFLDANYRRAGGCEVSTIDTALFLNGAVLTREYFRDPEITRLVDEIYGRIDWQWALNGGLTLTHGWTPEGGFLPYRWDDYSECLGMYLLGIGAPYQALPSECWDAWSRKSVVSYGGNTYIHCPALFTHQYAHAWFDLRGKRDRYANYWDNSRSATLAQRQWAEDRSKDIPYLSRDFWGFTASDSPHGYVAWGGPFSATPSDGTVVPCAPAGSIPFAPAECIRALWNMRVKGGDQIWRKYGFADAFNLGTGWVDPEVIAINVGITVVMIENYRSGLVWEYFMRAPEVRKSMATAGFRDVGK